MTRACKIKQHKTHPRADTGPSPGNHIPRVPPRAASGGRGELGQRGQQNRLSLCTSAQFESSALTNPFLIELYRPELPKLEIETQPESHTKRRIIPGKCFRSPGALQVQNKKVLPFPWHHPTASNAVRFEGSKLLLTEGAASARAGSEPQPGCEAGTPQHPRLNPPGTTGSPEPLPGAHPHAGSAACSHKRMRGSVTCTGI